MFILLLSVTFLIAVAVCFLVVKLFQKSMDRILHRIIADELSSAWTRYLTFAVYVVGISSGVRIWDLEKYINPRDKGPDAVEALPLSLNPERWILEVYRTIIGTLQGEAWLLLVFFMVALIVFAIMRGAELKRSIKPIE